MKGKIIQIIAAPASMFYECETENVVTAEPIVCLGLTDAGGVVAMSMDDNGNTSDVTQLKYFARVYFK